MRLLRYHFHETMIADTMGPKSLYGWGQPGDAFQEKRLTKEGLLGKDRHLVRGHSG